MRRGTFHAVGKGRNFHGGYSLVSIPEMWVYQTVDSIVKE